MVFAVKLPAARQRIPCHIIGMSLLLEILIVDSLHCCLKHFLDTIISKCTRLIVREAMLSRHLLGNLLGDLSISYVTFVAYHYLCNGLADMLLERVKPPL